MVPSLSPVLGIGDYSAFVAGDIAFQPDTSWSKPVLDRVDGYKDLPALGTAPWYGRFLRICEKLLQRFAGTEIPFMRGFFSPLDLANALRGDAIYLDFYDDPEAPVSYTHLDVYKRQDGFDGCCDIADLSRFQGITGLQPARPHDSQLHHVELGAGRHHPNGVSGMQLSFFDADIDDNALVAVIIAVKDQRLQRLLILSRRRGNILYHRLQHLFDPHPLLGRN